MHVYNYPIKPYSALLATLHCVLHTKDCLHELAGGSASAERWDRGGGWGHPQGGVHMVAAIGLAVCERTMVGTGWATSHPSVWTSLEKHYHIAGISCGWKFS